MAGSDAAKRAKDITCIYVNHVTKFLRHFSLPPLHGLLTLFTDHLSFNDEWCRDASIVPSTP